jgi:hypothetical protein
VLDEELNRNLGNRKNRQMGEYSSRDPTKKMEKKDNIYDNILNRQIFPGKSRASFDTSNK